jgi:glycosyltransferase involved in cell wall biosynthesis
MSNILLHSNAPWAASGYGQQTKLFAPRLRDLGHHVAISAFSGLSGSILGWDGMTVYPSDERYGNRMLPDYADQEDADLVLTLMDVWVLDAKKLGKLPLACWVPIDHQPMPIRVLEFFRDSGARPIAMSRFGERMLTDSDLTSLYVPHGIETEVFRPRRDVFKKTRARMGVAEDAFVVGMVAANKGNAPSRKGFPEAMQAFALLLKDHPDAQLYMHTEPAGYQSGVPIGRLMETCGVPEESVFFTNPVHVELGMKPEQMATMYSAFDVLLNPSYGEGFGIPIVEAQSCGVPVIVTDCTAMTELCGAGWLVEGDPWYNPGHGAFFARPSVEGIHQALLSARDARDDADLRAKARKFALQYDADLVTEQFWRPALTQLLPSNVLLPAA